MGNLFTSPFPENQDLKPETSRYRAPLHIFTFDVSMAVKTTAGSGIFKFRLPDR